jgi:hypothetical protein
MASLTECLAAAVEKRAHKSFSAKGTSSDSDSKSVDDPEAQEVIAKLMTEHLSDYLRPVLPLMIEAMDIEENVEDITATATHLTQILECMESNNVDPRECLTMETLEELVTQLCDAVSERILRGIAASDSFASGDGADSSQSDLRKRAEDGGVGGSLRTPTPSESGVGDEEDDEYSAHAEAEFANAMADIFAVLCRLFRESFAKLLRSRISHIAELFSRDDESDRALGVTLMTEVIGHCGEDAAKAYAPNVLKVCHESLRVGDGGKLMTANLRQSAAFAIGVCAQNRTLHNACAGLPPMAWIKLLQNVCIAARTSMVSTKGEDGDEDESEVLAIENAISAMGKIIENYGNFSKSEDDSTTPLGTVTDTQRVAAQWLQMLPLANDAEERAHCNRVFVRCMHRFGEQWLSDGGIAFLKHCVRIVAVALSEGESKEEMGKMLVQLQSKTSREAVAKAADCLPEGVRECVKPIIY